MTIVLGKGEGVGGLDGVDYEGKETRNIRRRQQTKDTDYYIVYAYRQDGSR